MKADVHLAGGSGVALRTLVYHEVMVGYLDYIKRQGFTSMFIWACPPLQVCHTICSCVGVASCPCTKRFAEWGMTALGFLSVKVLLTNSSEALVWRLPLTSSAFHPGTQFIPGCPPRDTSHLFYAMGGLTLDCERKCPPVASASSAHLQGDDYILYCHPNRQKTPRSDRLREWYHTLLRQAKNEGIVTYLSNLYDTFFEGGKDHRVEKPSVLHLPYFEGAPCLLSGSPHTQQRFDLMYWYRHTAARAAHPGTRKTSLSPLSSIKQHCILCRALRAIVVLAGGCF